MRFNELESENKMEHCSWKLKMDIKEKVATSTVPTILFSSCISTLSSTESSDNGQVSFIPTLSSSSSLSSSSTSSSAASDDDQGLLEQYNKFASLDEEDAPHATGCIPEKPCNKRKFTPSEDRRLVKKSKAFYTVIN